MQISVKLVENNQTIQKEIQNEINKHIKIVLSRAAGNLTKLIQSILLQAIKDAPEYSSLVGGQLRGEFGLTNANLKLDEIIEVWMNHVIVTINNNKLTIEMVRSDYSDVLSLDGANQLTEHGTNLPWLEWLLLEGDRIIIRNYTVKTKVRQKSRTGINVMVHSDKKSWGVPPEFSGTSKDNWITRAIDSVEPDIHDLIKKEIIRQW